MRGKINMKELLHKALQDYDSRPVKVFLFSKKRNEEKQVADGKVRFNNKFLFSNREKIKRWILESIESPFGILSFSEFVEPKGVKWTNNLDDVFIFMAALDVLGLGQVIGNTEREEYLKGQGFNCFPMFRFNEK